MKTVNRHFLVFLALGCVCIGESRADNRLTMDADTPEVNIKSRGINRNFLRLPKLQYEFHFDAACVANLAPVSLQLSVADTRKTLDESEIATDKTTEISLSIPANQIAPVAIEGFCERDEAEDEIDGARSKQQITIPAALSAQASLRCASDLDEQMIYVSRPLDVTLICEQ